MNTRICAFPSLSRRHYILNDTCRPEKAVMRRDIALIRAGCVFCSLHNLCQKMLTSITENYAFFLLYRIIIKGGGSVLVLYGYQFE